MKKLALALAAVAALGFTAPSFVSDASAAQGMKIAAADTVVKVKRGHGRGHVTKVVTRRDHGMRHRGWAHSRHQGATKKVIIKHRNGRTVKKVIHRG
jgi:predicted lysophospholipase L1 biosynthesis ABC-type transport system permease subunit